MLNVKLEKLEKALINKGYTVKIFENKEEASDYLDNSIDNMIVGFGDSKTLDDLYIAKRLATHNTVFDPAPCETDEEFDEVAKMTLTTEIFLTSVNAISENGEMVNIDGTGNRVSGSLFGHKKVYFVLGVNKICDNLDNAIYRARNIAAPKNTCRLRKNTPCTKINKCFDCKSKDRICNVIALYLHKMNNIEAEVVIIKEELGF